MDASKTVQEKPRNAVGPSVVPARGDDDAAALPRFKWLLIAGLLVFAGAFALDAVAPITTLDPDLANRLHGRLNPAVTTAMLAISAVNSLRGIALMSAVFALWLAHRRQTFWMLVLIIAVPGGMLLNAILKLVFARLRPSFDDPILLLHTYSFPSGHVAASTVFYAIVAAFLGAQIRSVAARALIAFGALTMIALVAFSRMYLGVHYLSDVIGGFLESVLWLALCVGLVTAYLQRHPSAPAVSR